MVSTTTTNSGRKYIPMQYLDILWNRFEKYGEKTNRIIMGINDKGLGNGWKSLITKGYPRGRFFFNYADLVLENPYRGDNYKYYFQLQYFLYDKKEQDLFVIIEGSVFNLELKERMNTAVVEIPNEILKGQKEISVIFTFNSDFLSDRKQVDIGTHKGDLHKSKNIKNDASQYDGGVYENKSYDSNSTYESSNYKGSSNYHISGIYKDNAYLEGNMEKMSSAVFDEYVKNFNDLFVIEAALLSEDSQYLRRELAKL